jgi:hypothetical protein
MKTCTLMKGVIPASFRSREEPSLLRFEMTPAANELEREENKGGKRTDGQALAERPTHAVNIVSQ